MSDTALEHTIRFNPIEVALPTGSTPGRFLSRGYVDRFRAHRARLTQRRTHRVTPRPLDGPTVLAGAAG
ncbi:MAG: hypothetical protein V4796_30685 [Burkholderia cenocepacia]